MKAIPKPKKTYKSSEVPKRTEEDFEEIGEALEFGNEVEITTYHQKQYESAWGVITSADGQIGKLTMQMGYEYSECKLRKSSCSLFI